MIEFVVVIVTMLAGSTAWPQTSPKDSTTGSSMPASGVQGRFPTLDSIHIQSSLVVVPVAAIDHSGDFVEDLGKSDFRVLDDGMPQQIARFGLATEPVAAVLVIQANDGVAPLLDQVHPLGLLLSNLLLGSSGEAAVITYSDKIQLIQRFSSDPATLSKTLKHVTAGGGKARLNDALGRALLMLANQTDFDRRVVIVISDGLDRGSLTRRDQILRAATGADVVIYGLRFGPMEASMKGMEPSGTGPPPGEPTGVMRPDSTPSAQNATDGINLSPLVGIALGMGRKASRKNTVHWYAHYTGGVSYTSSKKDTLQKQLQKIALEINSQYVLAYVPSTLNRTGFHPIRVTVSRPGLKIRTRAGYFYGVPEH